MTTCKALLGIVPPYRTANGPPAAAAALLGHLKREGLAFEFLDLRLSSVLMEAPTYESVGPFGENYVIDMPDLPLALAVIADFERGEDDLRAALDTDWMHRYCMNRALTASRVIEYLVGMSELARNAFATFDALGFCGFSTWSSNYVTTLIICAHLKRRKNPPFIVLGGPQVTESRASALLALRSGLADAVVLGEGEAALVDIYKAWESGDFPEGGIPSTLLRRSGDEVIEGPSRRQLHLTTLAAPDFDQISLPDYRSGAGSVRLPFQLSRGCTDKCSFCSEWVFWKHFRLDTVDHAVEQLASIVETTGVRAFDFTDSLLNGHMRRLRQFAENIIERGLKIDFGGFMRADMDAETAKLLKTAGLSYAFIGVESLSDDTLELMNKRRTENDNARAIRAFLEEGIAVITGVIAGFPGDKRERFAHTIDILRGISDSYPGLLTIEIVPFIVSPAQPIFARLDEVGLVTAGWPDEVLDIAPRHRVVTERIVCTVTGSNQGLERLGQFRLGRSLKDQQTNSAVGRAGERAIDRLVFGRRGASVFGFATLLMDGKATTALVTPEERARFNSIMGLTPASVPLSRHPDFLGVWKEVQAGHLWGPDRTIHAGAFANDLRDVREICMSNNILARPFPTKPGFVLGNANSGGHEVLDQALAPILVWLSQAPRPTQEVHERLCSSGLNDAAAWALLNRLARGGFLRPYRFSPRPPADASAAEGLASAAVPSPAE